MLQIPYTTFQTSSNITNIILPHASHHSECTGAVVTGSCIGELMLLAACLFVLVI
jgi:hypothetical protein